MADVTELRMNVAALKRVDPYVKEILETATHVALYTFNGVVNEWERTDVEGALFVYSRSGEPFNGILIMNRLNTNNLLEPVMQGLELQLQEPFLLYRNTKGRIYGIWFYDKDECIRIASMLDKLVREMNIHRKNPDKAASKSRANGSGVTDMDIFSMLNKAQEIFNSNKVLGKSKSTTEVRPQVKGEDVPPQSVMDFFAKASGTAPHFQTEKAPHQIPGLYVDPTQRTTLLQEANGGDRLKPLLQRLMSNPAHSVEHIEMKQRSVTPHAETAKSRRSKQTDSEVNSGSGFKIRPLSSGDIGDSMSRLVPFGPQHAKIFSEPPNFKPAVENGMSFLRITSPISTVPPLTPFLGSAVQTGATSGIAVDTSSSDQRPLSAPLCCSIETPVKPALMPPTMFTSSASKTTICGEVGERTPVMSVLPMSSSVLDESGSTIKLEPLTKNQLIQAFNYLIKHDPEFVNKLHEAYVKSIAEMVH